MAESIAPVKNRRRIRSFWCFNTVSDDEEPCLHSASQRSADDDSGRRRKTTHRSFSGWAPSLKKFRSKRYREDSSRPISNLSSKNKKLMNSTKKKSSCDGFWDPKEFTRDNSDRSSLFSPTSSSSASSISSNSRSRSERNTGTASLGLRQASTNNGQQQGMERVGSKCNYNPATGMCILLVCLVALVFWGKAFAIVTCTTAWLFVAPASRRGDSSVNNVVDSEEYKKRVIMEGLLERNNRPRV